MLHAEVERDRTAAAKPGSNGRDLLLKDAANILKETCRESDVIARIGGDEFVVIPVGATEADTDRVVARLQKSLEFFNSKRKDRRALSIRYGASHCDTKSLCCLDELFQQECRATDKENKTADDGEDDGPLRG